MAAVQAVNRRQRAGSVTIVEPGPDQCQQDETGPLDLAALKQRLEQARARSQELIDRIENGRSLRERLQESAFARLQARLRSMPVIEQAKGIVMAQQRCGPDEAFDLLRRASQRANVKVSVLAEQVVKQVAAPGSGGSAEQARMPGRGHPD